MSKRERWLVDKDGFVTVLMVHSDQSGVVPQRLEHKGKTYEFSEVYEDVQLYSEKEEEGQA